MNQKAQKAQLEFPLLLNMQEDRPAIHNDFRSVERMNAPYLNGMISPLYRQKSSKNGPTIFDNQNNKYEIKDGALYKNENKLFDIENRMFSVKEVEYPSDYICFDVDSDRNVAYIKLLENNSVEISYDNSTVVTNSLFLNGNILNSRIRIIGDTAIGVVIYIDDSSKIKCLYVNTKLNRRFQEEVEFCYTTPRANTSAAYNVSKREIDVTRVDPIIYISSPLSSVYAVSLITNYGEILNTKTEGFWTLVDYDDNGTRAYLYGQSFRPKNVTVPSTTLETKISSYNFSVNFSTNIVAVPVYNDGTNWRYVDTQEIIPLDVNFNPVSTGTKVDIGGVEYTVFSARLCTSTCKVTSDVDFLYEKAASLTVTMSGGLTSTESYTDNHCEVTINRDDWVNQNGSIPTFGITGLSINYDSTDYNVPLSYLSSGNYYQIITQEETTEDVGFLIAPNVFLDTGKMYAFYTFNQWSDVTNSWSGGNVLSQNNIIAESGYFTGIDSNEYTFTTDEFHKVDAYSIYARSNSVGVGQWFYQNSSKYSYGTRTPYDLYISKNAEAQFSASVKFVEYSNSNCHDMLYYAGTFPNSDYKFFPYATANSEDVAWFNVGGNRAKMNGKWNAIYYTSEDGVTSLSGFSYSDNGKMGTLVTDWNSIDSDFYVISNDNFLIYRSSNGKLYEISVEDGNEISFLLDRFIVVNTTSYWNCYDTISSKKYHYASDYNNRCKLGIKRTEYQADPSLFTQKDARLFMTGINASYTNSGEAITSLLPSLTLLSHILSDTYYIHLYESESPQNKDTQPIEVYAQASDEGEEYSIGGISTTAAKYKYSIEPYTNELKFRDNRFIDLLYSGVSIIYTPSIFSKYINGAGNNDFVSSNDSYFPLLYLNTQPLFMYNAIGEIKDVSAFFIIQGQYYAVIENKIYGMTYSGGLVATQDAIVDIKGMEFVGNTPTIAFFWSEKIRTFYSFTGDAALQSIFDSSKFSLENFKFRHYYDETTQSIYILTDKGILVIGPANTYLLEEYKNVENIQFIDKNTYIISDDSYDCLVYYPTEDFEPLDVDMETSFYGIGNTESTTIDRWNITLYDSEMKERDVLLSVRTLTDVSTKSESKTLHINKNDWDSWSHSALISYSPKLIKGQGVRLSIKSPVCIQKIVPHISDNSTGTTTNRKFEV